MGETDNVISVTIGDEDWDFPTNGCSTAGTSVSATEVIVQDAVPAKKNRIESATGVKSSNEDPESEKSAETTTTEDEIGPDHSFKRDTTKLNILVGVTGSVATIKLEELVSEILRQSPDNRVSIRVVSTELATHFFDHTSFGFPVYRDIHEWSTWKTRGDPVLHIELRKWADIFLIAPLDANTLAKIANGFCDNLLTCVVRAWDPNKVLYFCPAMNTYMMEHPLTFKHLDVVKNLLNYKEIPSVEKELICGDKGYGAMAPVPMIASVIAGEVKKRFATISRS